MNINNSANSQMSNFQNSLMSSIKDSKRINNESIEEDKVTDNLEKIRSLSNIVKRLSLEKTPEELENNINNINLEKIVRKFNHLNHNICIVRRRIRNNKTEL